MLCETLMLIPLAFSPFQATCTWPPALQSEREEYGVVCVPNNQHKCIGELWRCVSLWWGMYAPLFCMGTFLLLLLGLAVSSSCLDFFPGAGFLCVFFGQVGCGKGEETKKITFLQMDEMDTWHILHITKYLPTSRSLWKVQVVMTVICFFFFYYQRDAIKMFDLAISGICSCQFTVFLLFGSSAKSKVET